MGMIGCFCSVTDADLEAILQKPSRIQKLWGEQVIATPSFLGKLFGKKSSPLSTDDWEPTLPLEEFDVDKAWQGIHFLLTGTEAEGEGPLAFILCGGHEIAQDTGYGPPHGFTSAEVKNIEAALRNIDIDALYKTTDPATLAAHDIYPEIWDEPKEECISYLTESLGDLRKFIIKTATQNRALIAYIG